MPFSSMVVYQQLFLINRFIYDRLIPSIIKSARVGRYMALPPLGFLVEMFAVI